MILAFRIPLRAFSDDSGSDLNPYKLENLIWIMIALIPFIFDLWYTRHTTRKLLSLIEPGNRIEIRFQSMNLVSRMFLCGICFILLPLVPLNWPEWENASLAGLTLAIVCILLILYYYFKLKSLPELKSELLSSAKKEDQDKKEQNQFLWGIARIVQISVLFLLFFLNFLSKPETLSFPARTQEDWLRQLVIFMVALLLFLSLLGFWHFLMKKLHRSFNSMAQFPVKLVAILLIVAIIMYLTVLSSKFTMIGSFNDGEQYSRHYTVSWSPDGKILASSSDHGRVYLLDLDGRLKRTLLGHVSNEYGATTVAWSPNGKMLASTSNDEKVLLWDVEGRPIGVLHTLDKIKFSTLVWSADSKILAVAASDQKIWWWSVPDQKLITTLSSHTDDITCLAWSPDGRFLASGSRNGTIWLWTADGKEAMVLRGHDDQVNALAWSPDSKILASGSGSRTADFEGKVDTTVRLWGVDGKTIAILDSHNYKVTALAWSPDGKRLVSSDYKGTIKLWNRQGKEISSFIKRDKEFQGLAWSPDGKRLAAAGYRPDVWIFKIED
jgi:Tol biopolymer transport system component